MQKTRTWMATLVFGTSLTLAAGALLAQEPVRTLRDLIGLRASSAEARLQARGYEFVHAEKVGDSAFSWFLEPRTRRCVATRTTNGHTASVVYAPDADCEVAPPELPPGPTSLEPGEEEFDTVCGVEVGGETHRYRCHLRNRGCSPGPGKRCTTTITMPDNEYRIAWMRDGKIEVTFQGMAARPSRVSTASGQTRFELDDTIYFVYRLKREADRELARLGY